MVNSHYANYNKYFRQLQTHPDIHYLLSHFVTPSSVVFIWNRLSLVLKGDRFDDFEWNNSFGCDMIDPKICIWNEDINHLAVIQEETDSEDHGGGQLSRCFSFENKPMNEYYVISTNEEALRHVYGIREEEDTNEVISLVSPYAKISLAKEMDFHPSQNLFSHCSSPVMSRPSFGRKDEFYHYSGVHIPSPLGARAIPTSNPIGRNESNSVVGETVVVLRSQEYDRRNCEGSQFERKGQRHHFSVVSMDYVCLFLRLRRRESIHRSVNEQTDNTYSIGGFIRLDNSANKLRFGRSEGCRIRIESTVS